MSRDKCYPAKALFDCCPGHCIEIEVKPGQVGSLRVFDAPDTFCFHVEHIHWGKCCKVKTFWPVKDPECTCAGVCCPLLLDGGGYSEDSLKPGHYKVSIFDCDGNAITPDDGEVVMEFSQRPNTGCH